MTFRINLATRSYINKRRLNTVLAMTLGLLSAWMLVNVYSISTNHGEIKKLEEASVKMTVTNGGVQKQIPKNEYEDLLSKINYANSIILKKKISWLNLLDNLESVLPEGVAISSIDPDVKGENIKLAGVAKSFSSIRILLEYMDKSNKFADVFLVSQGETKVGKEQKGITFSITCKVVR